MQYQKENKRKITPFPPNNSIKITSLLLYSLELLFGSISLRRLESDLEERGNRRDFNASQYLAASHRDSTNTYFGSVYPPIAYILAKFCL